MAYDRTDLDYSTIAEQRPRLSQSRIADSVVVENFRRECIGHHFVSPLEGWRATELDTLDRAF